MPPSMAKCPRVAPATAKSPPNPPTGTPAKKPPRLTSKTAPHNPSVSKPGRALRGYDFGIAESHPYDLTEGVGGSSLATPQIAT